MLFPVPVNVVDDICRNRESSSYGMDRKQM
jgi:hypothetical protein